MMKPRPETGHFGIYANDWIAPGELLSVWGGNVLTYEQLSQVSTTKQCYSVQIDDGLYLATVSAPESADFINHSCDPNAGLRDAITLVAMRLIAPYEEVCFDYSMADGSPIDEFDCACGTHLCRGQVTGNDWQLPALWERYDNYFSPYLRRRIAQLRKERVYDSPAY
jgi:hypothetical protein